MKFEHIDAALILSMLPSNATRCSVLTHLMFAALTKVQPRFTDGYNDALADTILIENVSMTASIK